MRSPSWYTIPSLGGQGVARCSLHPTSCFMPFNYNLPTYIFYIALSHFHIFHFDSLHFVHFFLFRNTAMFAGGMQIVCSIKFNMLIPNMKSAGEYLVLYT